MKSLHPQIRDLKRLALRVLPLLFAGMSATAVSPSEKDDVPSVLEGDAIVRRNGVYYNNRPLYAGQDNRDQRYYWVFAGDRPFVRFGGGPHHDGCFMPGFERPGGPAKWLMDFKSVEARYHPGWMEWVASDPEFPGVSVTWRVLPLGTGFGMASQAEVAGAAKGDNLVWMLGATHPRWMNFIDPMAADSRHVRYEGFDPSKAQGNGVELDSANGVVRFSQGGGFKGRHTAACWNTAPKFLVGDADQWQSLSKIIESSNAPSGIPKRPMAIGLTPVVDSQPVTMIAHVWPDQAAASRVDVTAEYSAAQARIDSICNRVVSKTPDARFDFMVRAAGSPVDALWREAAFGHGCLSAFVSPLLGWRSTLAGVAYGRHDRVLTAARTFFASQVTGDSYKEQPELAKIVENNEELDRYEGTLCHPGKNPLFFSKGRLIPNQNSTMYDMQSQFVDAVVEDWRFTADPEMEKLLRPALERHLDYIARCFDPAGNGTYESFNNTFLTDTVWTNGGGTPDETAFAWRGHLAARDMARRANDTEAVKRHEARLALIRKGFFERLWVDKAGHPGAYREQGGYQRLHEDAWMPGLYLPLDCAGLMNDEQMASTLHFVEYALEHEPRPSGGVRVWPSNWVPSTWSNRTKAPGDEYHMALGYCFAGMPEGAMDIIQGNISEGAFESGVPGNLGFNGGSCGTDFGDCVAPFARVVVSGVFGYRPDRPNGLVTIAPQFPATWDHAEITHPEFKLAYKREGTTERLSVELTRESQIELQLPFRGSGLKSAKLSFDGVAGEQPDSRKMPGAVRPGFGRSIYVVRTPALKKAELILEVNQELPTAVAQTRETEIGAPVEMSVEGGRITEVRDAQRLLDSLRIADGKATARIANNAGHHRVLALVQMQSGAPQWRTFDFNVRDSKAEQYAAEKNLTQAPANASWTGIDLSRQLNGRVTDIFRQEYVSPRPPTMSLRLAKDGYQVWNGVYAGKLPPAIDLSNTRPRRPMPIYDANLGQLQTGGELTIEVWAQVDLCDSRNWTTARILQLGDFTMDILSNSGRLLRLSAPQPIIHSSSNFCGERTSHLAIVLRSGKPGQLFFDGKKCIVGTDPVNLASLSLGALRLGANEKGENRMMGRIDRVAISTRAATPEELKERSLESVPLAGSVGDWRIPQSELPMQVISSVAGAPPLVRQEITCPPASSQSAPLKVAAGMLEVPQGAKFRWAPGDRDIAFTSLWDNWPKKVEVPVHRTGDSAWLLVAGSTNPMQVRIANGVLRFEYADGVVETLDLVDPMNFWSLCAFHAVTDYEYRTDAFALPKNPPSQVQLGTNCRAMVYGWKLRTGVELKNVTLESLSQEVIIGLMGLSICN